MKKLIRHTLIASVLAFPALSFAQSGAGLTRAQVYNDLVRLEQAGYRPSAGEDARYPEDLQAAEARIAVEEASRVSAGRKGDVDPSSLTAQQ